ncbi:hypothetical protein OAC50_00985 [bacterium]|nr:hypothetical protein [bacterium]|tara:strand:- start:138 stop:1298 length:1161 start_codon:yes stop_codon:yes gene_type:complete
MANIAIWPGSSSFSPGDTPFGFYDNDPEFQKDADKFSVFAARRLGYPIVDIELQNLNFYAALEEAVTIYANELYGYKVRDNYLTLEGADASKMDIESTVVVPNLGRIIQMAEQYGVEAGTGGNVDWHKGSVQLTASVQDYNLEEWAKVNIPHYKKHDIEIMRVYYESPPAIVKFFDPYVGTGMGAMNMMDSFGFGDYSPAINFVLMPLNYDLQVIQQIEMSDTIRRSNYSFEMHNNHLRIFPIPDGTVKEMYFEYILGTERSDASFVVGESSTISNIYDVPYTNPNYDDINSIGRSWIFEYALALCKEMLGYIRGKYQTVPIPGDTVTLNQGDLITAATNEKERLIDRLRAYLGETSREKLLERRAAESKFIQDELANVPFPIYIG